MVDFARSVAVIDQARNSRRLESDLDGLCVKRWRPETQSPLASARCADGLVVILRTLPQLHESHEQHRQSNRAPQSRLMDQIPTPEDHGAEL